MRVTTLFLIGLMTLLLPGCGSSKYKEAIVGKWVNSTNPGAALEFTKDGKVTGVIVGTYSLDGSDILWITMEKEITVRGKKTNKLRETITISGDLMTMVDPDGTKTSWKMVK